MATLPIHLEVEDVAVGPILIALRKMPGIIKMNLDIGIGAPPVSREAAPRGNNAERIIALLMQSDGGPIAIKEVMQTLGVSKGSVYSAVYALKKKNVVESPVAGQYQLTVKAKRELMKHEPKLLNAPSAKEVKAKTNGHAIHHGDIERGPSGRASQGSGRKLLLDALAAGPITRLNLGKHLASSGMSAKSMSGVMDRAKRDELIKKHSDNNYHLTAKGKHEAAKAATAAPTTGAE